jgi:hypothetical protein
MDPKQHDGGRGLSKTSAPAAHYSRPVSFRPQSLENRRPPGELVELNEAHRQNRPAGLFGHNFGLSDL